MIDGLVLFLFQVVICTRNRTPFLHIFNGLMLSFVFLLVIYGDAL